MKKELIEKGKEAVMKLAEVTLKNQHDILETFLLEYCEKNNIKESELKGVLGIYVCPEESTISIVPCNNPTEVFIGCKIIPRAMNSFSLEIFGNVNLEKDYPKTKFTIDILN